MIKAVIPERTDYEEIVILVNDADKIFFSIYSSKDASEVGVANETVQSLIKGEPNRKYLILRDANKIVAFTSFRLKNSQTVWISSLYVHINYHRKGFGATLLKEIEEIAKKEGARVVVGETETKADWAIKFYIKSGYSILKKEDLKKFPYNQVLDKEPVSNRYIIGKMVNS